MGWSKTIIYKLYIISYLYNTMRGYILIILPSLFFNFGCSSPEKNVSNDKKNNELVSLEFIRKDKQERVSRDGHKVIPSPEIQRIEHSRAWF